MIYKLNSEGHFIFSSEKLTRLLQIDTKELYGKSYYKFIRQDYISKTINHYKNQISSNEPSSYFELPIVTNLNEVIWIGQTVEIIYGSDGIKEILVAARDITDRVITEEKYNNIIQNIDLGLMEVDLQEKIVYVNDFFCKSLGYSKNELINRTASDLFLSKRDSHGKTLQKHNKELKLDIHSSYEMKLMKKNGEHVWMMISSTPVKSSKNQTIGSVGIYHDITDKKSKEEQRIKLLKQLEIGNKELAKKQQYLKAINGFAKKLIDSIGINETVKEITEVVIDEFNFTDCVVYLIDESKTYLSQVCAYGAKNNNGKIVNPIIIKVGEGIVGSVALSGKAEIVNDTSEDPRYIVDDELRLSELAVPIIADDEIIGVIDSENIRADFYNEEHLETLQTIANMTATKIKNSIIVEKHHKVDVALSESEHKSSSIISSAMDAVITIDDKGIVAEWNPQAEEIFEYSKEEAIGQKLSELIIPENYREMHETGMKEFLRSGKGSILNQRIEVPSLNKSGKEFPIELSIVVIKMKGRSFFSAFARDITIRRKAENDMKHALDKLRELNAMKTKFVSMTSHELRTPLTTIQTNFELLELRLEKEKLSNADKYDQNFSRISTEIKKLTDLMNDILLMGKIESGKIKSTPSLFNMEKLCEEIIEELDNKNDGATIKLEIVGHSRKSYLDFNTYRHVISNLISNALKYSSGSKMPYVKLFYGEGHIKIDVTDYGIGIPENEQGQLFDSFFRASNVENIQGTGLGLSIVKEFIDLHGGSISVDSTVGKGATFSIYQPDQEVNVIFNRKRKMS